MRFFLALKVKLNFLGKINLKLGAILKRMTSQDVYFGDKSGQTVRENVKPS